MKKLVTAVWASLLLAAFIPGAAFAYPQLLDSAQPGPVSTANPFFTNVLSTPIISGKWVKMADNLYEGPTKKLYSYDPETGRVSQVTGTK